MKRVHTDVGAGAALGATVGGFARTHVHIAWKGAVHSDTAAPCHHQPTLANVSPTSPWYAMLVVVQSSHVTESGAGVAACVSPDHTYSAESRATPAASVTESGSVQNAVQFRASTGDPAAVPSTFCEGEMGSRAPGPKSELRGSGSLSHPMSMYTERHPNDEAWSSASQSALAALRHPPGTPSANAPFTLCVSAKIVA